MSEPRINHYQIADHLNPAAFETEGTTVNFYGDGLLSISQRNSFSNETQEIFLSRDLALSLALLIRDRERAGVFNE